MPIWYSPIIETQTKKPTADLCRTGNETMATQVDEEIRIHAYECENCHCRVNFKPVMSAEFGIAMCFSCTEYNAGRLDDDLDADPFEDDAALDCDCADYDTDLIEGRAWCGRCGRRWDLTADQVKSEIEFQAEYMAQFYCDEA